MGYTHYWYRVQTIADEVFQAIRSDFEKLVLPLSDVGIELAGGLGEGPPKFTRDLVWFNGLKECGHPATDELVIPYPSEHAHGVGPSSTAIDGSFHNLGVTVKHRCCSGRCSFETFSFARVQQLKPEAKPDENGLYCEYVKTGFRPYDIAVTAVLLIAKHHLHEEFVVHSNGADAQWWDARQICQRVLGYGDWLGIVEEPVLEDGRPLSGSTQPRQVNIRKLVEVEPPKLTEGRA